MPLREFPSLPSSSLVMPLREFPSLPSSSLVMPPEKLQLPVVWEAGASHLRFPSWSLGTRRENLSLPPEAPTSRCQGSWSFPFTVPKLELGNQERKPQLGSQRNQVRQKRETRYVSLSAMLPIVLYFRHPDLSDRRFVIKMMEQLSTGYTQSSPRISSTTPSLKSSSTCIL